MAKKIAQLEKEQYNPRMIYLQEIELSMKERMVSLCLSQEKLETGFICGKDLKLFEKATTLSCCHTFCACCVDEIRQENFNVLICPTCKKVSETPFRNEKLDSIKHQFLDLKKNTHIFGEWFEDLSLSYVGFKLCQVFESSNHEKSWLINYDVIRYPTP
jgi:hypothetical protein